MNASRFTPGDGDGYRAFGWVVLAPLLLVVLALIQCLRLSHGELPGGAAPWRLWCAGAMLAGLLAALLGAWGMAQAARAGRAALAARTALIEGFAGWLRMLPRFLGVVLGLLALGLAALLLQEAALTLARWHEVGRLGAGEIGRRLLWLATLGGLAWGAARGFWRARSALARPVPLDLLGRAVSARQAPGLWWLARELAIEAGAEPPAHIVVGLRESIFATAHPVRLRPRQRLLKGRTLYLPLPCLALLSEEETRAVVAHELAHFAGLDRAYSERFAPLHHDFGVRLRALAEAPGGVPFSRRPALRFAQYLMACFQPAVAHWRQRRELAADAVAARVASPRAVATGLLHINAVQAQVAGALQAVTGQPEGRVLPLGQALREARDEAVRRLVDDGWARQAPAHPLDAHPPTPERIGAIGLTCDGLLLGRVRDRVAQAEPRPLDRWFADPVAVEQALMREFRAAIKKPLNSDGTCHSSYIKNSNQRA